MFTVISPFCQIRIVDAETLEPIPHVKIQSASGYKSVSDSEGLFDFDRNLHKELTFSHQDYMEEKILMKELLEDTVYLFIKYNTMKEIVVTGKPIGLPDIFKELARRIPDNFISSQIPLIYKHQLSVCDQSDTLLVISMPILAHGTNKKFYLAYRNYYLKDSVMVSNNGFQSKLSHLPNFFNYLNQARSAEKLFNASYAKDLMSVFDVIISSYEKNNHSYLDLLFIPKPKSQIKGKNYETVAYHSGYSQIMNYQINMSDYALDHLRFFSIPDNDETQLDFSQIKNRDHYNELLTRYMHDDASYVFGEVKFSKAIEDKLIIERIKHVRNNYNPIGDQQEYSKKRLCFIWKFDRKAEVDWNDHWELLPGYKNLYEWYVMK